MRERLLNSCRQISSQVDVLAEAQAGPLLAISHQLTEIFTRGGQLILAGQGPLQAVAQQIATAFSHRLGFERPPLPAVALGCNPIFAASLIDDQQSQDILAREYRLHSERDHMLLLFCSDRPSLQINQLISQIEDARSLVLIGPETQKAHAPERKSTQGITLPGDSAARLAELSLICGHLLCELVEGELFGV